MLKPIHWALLAMRKSSPWLATNPDPLGFNTSDKTACS